MEEDQELAQPRWTDRVKERNCRPMELLDEETDTYVNNDSNDNDNGENN